MAIILEAVAANGAVQRVPLADAATVVPAQPGLRYRLFNDAGGRVSPAALVKRVDGDLVVEGLADNKSVSLQGFFSRCTPQNACSLSMENIGGTPDEAVTPATQPVATLPDGGFLMYASGMTASEVVAARDTEFSFKPLLGVAGGLAIIGAAGGGGGGSSGKSSDTTPPGAPVITSGEFTKEAKPTIAGTAEPGSKVTLTLDVGSDGKADVTYDTTVASNGIWSIDTATATPTTGSLPTIAEGVTTSLSARAVDGAGNASALTIARLTLDTHAPPAPSIDSPLLTNDTTPVIYGFAEPGSIVTVELDLNRDGTPDVRWNATANAAGAYSVDVGSAPASGSLPGGKLGDVSATGLSVFASDLAGNASPRVPAELRVDTSIPPAPTIATIAGDNRINATEAGASVTISGTLDAAYADRPVNVQWGSLAPRAATVTGTAWSITIAAGDIPADGVQTVRATYVNAAGTTSVEATQPVVIDRVVPGAPSIALNTGSDSGALGDGITNDNTPTIRVALTGTGAVAGDTIEIRSGTTAVATAAVSASDVSAGYVDVTTASLGADGAKTLTATLTDVVGNVSSASASLPITIDTTPPGVPTVASLTTNDTTPTITGTAPAGDALTVTVNGVTYPVGADLVRSGSTWTLTIPAANALAQGTYDVVARLTDAAGNFTHDTSTNELAVDTTPPAQAVTVTAVADDVAPNKGTVPNGGTTNDAAPLVSGTLSAGLGAGESLQVLRNGTVIGTASVSGTSWSFADSGLVNGTTYAYTARVVDSAGNQGTASSDYSITVLTAAPTKTAAVTLVTDDVAPITGTVAKGGTTNDTEPVVSGTLSATLAAGESLEVLRNGTAIGNASVSGTSWTFADSGLADGTTYAYTARVVDAAGNPGTAGAAYSITVDTSAPAQAVTITAVNDNVAPVIGTVAHGGFTNDTTPALNGTLSTGLGTGEILQVFRDGTLLGNANVSGTNWTFADSGLANGATYDYTARVVDAAGNQGTASSGYSITVDTAAPAQAVTITAVTDNVAPVTDTVANGGFTNDTTPALAGTLSGALGAGETLQVFRDGTLLGNASITGTNWTFADSGLANGTTYAYTARVVDAAGNQGAASSGYSITVDTASPTVTISNVLDDAPPVTGPVANGGTTDDNSPTLVLTFSELFTTGGKLEVFRDGLSIGFANPAINSTTVEFPDTTTPADGTHTYRAQMTDAAGNVGSLSDPYTVTITTI